MAEQKIFGLVGQAMREIGAIGKESRNQQQGFMYRGVDAVYNALNPVMSKLGLFMTPEVLEQTREERVNKNGTTLLYSILKMKYTLYAPDGSNVSCVVIGEGMDSGDKASNKAMSVAFKYACFELFCIPTEEMVDPDSEVHEVQPKNGAKQPPKTTEQPAPQAKPKPPASLPANSGRVEKVKGVPPVQPQANAEPPADPVPPVLAYLAKERDALRVQRGISKAENNALWKAQLAALVEAKMTPDKPLAEYTQQEAEALIDGMYKNFAPTGTELKGGLK